MNTTCALNGWLSPDGKLYPCEAGEHWQCCDKIIKDLFRETRGDPMIAIVRLGWVKLQTDTTLKHSSWVAHQRNTGAHSFRVEDLTTRQIEVIITWTQLSGRRSPLACMLENREREMAILFVG